MAGAAQEQERLVPLIPVLWRDHFLLNLVCRSLADGDSLPLSLEGSDPRGPLAGKLLACTPARVSFPLIRVFSP